MFGTMEFDNTSQISKFSALSNMRNITGKLIVHNTNFQNISFLENVVKFRGNSANASIDLRDNKNMTHFGLNNLTVYLDFLGFEFKIFLSGNDNSRSVVYIKL